MASTLAASQTEDIGLIGLGVMGENLALNMADHGYRVALVTEVEQSSGYRVMPGVTALLPRLVDAGIMLGLVSGAFEAAAHIKLARGSDSSDRGEFARVAIDRCSRLNRPRGDL